MPTTTTRLALSKPLGTETVDIDVLNANADKIDAAAGTTICTSTTRPSSPYSGQLIYETDTTYHYTYSGGWKLLNPVQSTNYVINGGMDIWQRGTSQTVDGYASADRWNVGRGGATWGRGTSVPAGCGSSYWLGITAGTATNWITQHAIELNATGSAVEYSDGQYTLSFWAAAPNGLSFTSEMYYADGAGGGNQTAAFSSQAHTGIGAWKKYSVVTTPSSVTPNGTNKCIRLAIYNLAGVAFSSFGITSVQFEKGSVATPFRRAGGTIQGELAACNRYYVRFSSSSDSYAAFGVAMVNSAGGAGRAFIQLPVPMRTNPSSTFDWTGSAANYAIDHYGIGGQNLSSLTFYASTPQLVKLDFLTAAVATGGQTFMLQASNNAIVYLGFSAEL